MYLCIDSTAYVQYFFCVRKKSSLVIKQQQQQAASSKKRKIAILHVFPNMTLKNSPFSISRVGVGSDSFEQISFTQWKTLEGYKCDDNDDDDDDDDEGRKRASSMA